MTVRTNLARDPQLKVLGNSNNAALWGTPTRDTSVFPPGTANALRTSRTADAGSPTIIGSSYTGATGAADPLRILVNPGQVISCSMQVRTNYAPSATNAFQVLNFRNAAGGSITTATGPTISIPSGAWGRVVIENVVAPALTAYVWTHFTAVAADAGTVPLGTFAWCGAVLIEESTTAGNYFDGSRADAPPYDFGWTGATDASTSSATFDIVPLQESLQRLSATSLDAQGAANVWAGTSGLDLLSALNYKAGTTGIELQGVLNVLAGTQGLGVDEAASRIVA